MPGDVDRQTVHDDRVCVCACVCTLVLSAITVPFPFVHLSIITCFCEKRRVFMYKIADSSPPLSRGH
jgi:hypothetical protein